MNSKDDHYFLRVPLFEEAIVNYDEATARRLFSSSVEEETFMEEKKNKFKKLGLPWEDRLVYDFDKFDNPIYFDKTNLYKLNSLGYRSPEFDGSADILYAGCSNTFGMGVPEDAIWGSVLAKKLGSSYVNLSKQGASTEWIVKNIFSYINTYGHPKEIYCLFPDLFRVLLPTDKRILTSQAAGPFKDGDNPNTIIEAQLYGGGVSGLIPEYSRLPHDVRDVLPVNFSIYLYAQSILMLSTYCKSHGIKFIWSTWNIPTSDMFVELKQKFPEEYSGFIELDSKKWDNSRSFKNKWDTFEDPDCHLDLEKTYGLNFYRGTDDVHGVDHVHTGAHKHAHWAESFLDARLSS